jgi:hypothetical protein
MPDNTKNEAEPDISKTPIIEPRTAEAAYSPPAEQPPIDERSRLRARLAALMPELSMKYRTGPVAELIREIKAELVHPRDPSREYGDEPLSTKLRILLRLIELKEREAARLKRRAGRLSEI